MLSKRESLYVRFVTLVRCRAQKRTAVVAPFPRSKTKANLDDRRRSLEKSAEGKREVSSHASAGVRFRGKRQRRPPQAVPILRNPASMPKDAKWYIINPNVSAERPRAAVSIAIDQ